MTIGRRFIQSATDIFVGWTTAAGIDFYVRQFRDMKVIPSGEQVTPWLSQFARKCGMVLARAHATTGDAAAIDTYIGKGRTFDTANVNFARAYALQTTTTTPNSSKPSATARSRAHPAGETATLRRSHHHAILPHSSRAHSPADQ